MNEAPSPSFSPSYHSCFFVCAAPPKQHQGGSFCPGLPYDESQPNPPEWQPVSPTSQTPRQWPVLSSPPAARPSQAGSLTPCNSSVISCTSTFSPQNLAQALAAHQIPSLHFHHAFIPGDWSRCFPASLQRPTCLLPTVYRHPSCRQILQGSSSCLSFSGALVIA
ncbi:hypothetical protein B0T17DRAFT_5242 [Bombardia bombarda]|uniref:Uncharacterized protein n=1 Tax=Bombardia bombarda TaxID=252184 RepID=A0AA39XI90_9PEZI|nr:hypothetical protein B0T17DRAFT_5242 [Bombardia bombarda]